MTDLDAVIAGVLGLRWNVRGGWWQQKQDPVSAAGPPAYDGPLHLDWRVLMAAVKVLEEDKKRLFVFWRNGATKIWTGQAHDQDLFTHTEKWAGTGEPLALAKCIQAVVESET